MNKCTCKTRYDRSVGFNVQVGPNCAYCKAVAVAAKAEKEAAAQAVKDAAEAISNARAAIIADVFGSDKAAKVDFIVYSGAIEEIDMAKFRNAAESFKANR